MIPSVVIDVVIEDSYLVNFIDGLTIMFFLGVFSGAGVLRRGRDLLFILAREIVLVGVELGVVGEVSHAINYIN